ncbi:hypothetical protein GCM10008956_31650 [Deinococcus arenae]|uniref:Uncharacterized protein n=1 Tax=Deinococcus arenae TaxID=1452751 RepID=A0A8H9GRS8_9DEIO|nr:hypothetical protein GCM10008956_31650 [Deinococcus arenae]
MIPLRLVDFVQCVLQRPQIYTAHGTYDEVVAFIEGYHVGHQRTQTQRVEFGAWLQARLGEGQGRWLVRFRQGFSNDSTALSGLADAYNAFLQQRPDLAS